MSSLRKVFQRLFGKKEIDRAVENTDTKQEKASVTQGTELPKIPSPVLKRDDISANKADARADAEREQHNLPLFSERRDPATERYT